MLGVVVQIDGYDPVAAAPVTLRAASRDDVALCHLNGLTWWPAIAKLPTLRYDLFDGAFGGQITAPSSTLTLVTEAWADFGRYALADARLRLWTGELGADWAGYTLRFDGRISDQPQLKDGQASISFAVDDRWLDKALLSTYAGTTGAEGVAALKGQVKPIALGAPRYVAGTLIDTVNNVFQVSAGPVRGITAALDRLVRYGAPAADYPTYAALVAATVVRGTWATANAVGMARLGAPAEGQVSFLVEGDIGGTDGWARKPGQLMRRLAILSGGAGKIDNASLDRLDAARPYPLSLNLDQQTTAREVIQKLAASVNAVAGVTWTGSLFVAPIELATPTVTLAADGSSLPPVSSVEQIAIAPPWGKLAIGAERAWSVHALSDIAFTATLLDLGAYAVGTTYREGNIVAYQGSTWLFVNAVASSGNAPPMLPVEENGYWRVLARAGRDGNPGEVGSGSWTHIANSPTTIVTPNSARSTVSGGWGTDASQSKEGYTRGAAVDFVLPTATGSNRHAMAGLTAHPETGLSFDRISFAIYRAPDGYMDIRIDGQTYTSVNLPDAAKPVACRVEFDGVDTVRWYIAGTLRTTFFWAYPESPLFFASAFSGTDGQVNSIAFSAIGARGRNGSDGLPGKVGADGRTERTHYAYANAANGSVDFTVGAPDGRAYVGVYVDFTAADSTDPAAYVWSPYKGPASFGLAARGDVSLASNSLVKTGYAGWGGGGGYSTEGWKNGAQTSFKLATVDTIAGLNTDPTSNDSYETIDYAFHCSGDGNTYIYESGQPVLGLVGGNDGNRTFQVVYDNATVMYLVNGTAVRQIAVPANLTLYFDAAIAGVPGQRITDISFVASGTAGSNGAPGANGADGFGVITSPPAFVIPSFSNGTAKPAWQGGSCRIGLFKGGQEVVADSYTVVAAQNVSSLTMNRQNITFADIVGDKAEFTARATRGGVSYDQRVTIVRTIDGAAAFRSSVDFSAAAGSTGASPSTTVPAGRTVRIAASANYSASLGNNGRGIMYIYWSNLSDGGPENFLTQASGSIASRRNIGTVNEPQYENVPGSVSVSASFTSPSPDKLIQYRAAFNVDLGSPANIAGTVSLEVIT